MDNLISRRSFMQIAGAGTLGAGRIACGGLSLPTVFHAKETVDPYALTEEQKKLWYSKYYHETPDAPSEANLEALKAPMPIADAIQPDELEKLLDFQTPFKNGYALLDSGVAYAAMETVYTGVTADMYFWYRSWADKQEDQVLLYKMWFPSKHIQQIELPGATWAQEDIGCGPENVLMLQPVLLGECGLQKQLDESPQVIMAVGGSSLSLPCESSLDSRPLPSFLIHVYYTSEA